MKGKGLEILGPCGLADFLDGARTEIIFTIFNKLGSDFNYKI